MAGTTVSSRTNVHRWSASISRLITWSLALLLGMVIAANCGFLLIHGYHLLSYPYPLDYGEGPLLAQVDLLRQGTLLWHLYSDPAVVPYAVVNYPPFYHITTWVGSHIVGLFVSHSQLDPVLLAGRLVSLAAMVGAVAALWVLSGVGRTETWSTRVLRGLIVLDFLALPIVREWSVLMRVDMLGITLGLWGLVIVQRYVGRNTVLWAVPLMLLSLYVKPSLVAAPVAAAVWLLFRNWRQAMLFAVLLGGSGGVLFGLLQLASGGWFSLHVVTANANEWQHALANGFWDDQLTIHWPLIVAALISAGIASISRINGTASKAVTVSITILLPLYYVLFGAMTALGVGKVGAYTNYFLEFYAGLIWLAACIANDALTQDHPSPQRKQLIWHWVVVVSRWLVVGMVIAGLLRYYPTWSENYLKLAGIIEGENPPRIAFGSYSVWQDLQREQAILETMGRINTTMIAEVQAADAPIFTDIPGVAAQADQFARLQAFEHRQLYDVDSWGQQDLLLDMANGSVPLVALDFLGNWLTPEMIAMITHRYAQDGSRGTYDLYRPVDPGPRTPTDIAFPAGLRLSGYHLAPSPGSSAYHGGENVLLTLVWKRQSPVESTSFEVVTQITDGNGVVLMEVAQPLVYNALSPEDWPEGVEVQHMQTIPLPFEIPTRTYGLAVTLRVEGQSVVTSEEIAQIEVEEPTGRSIGERGYYVPVPFFEAWQESGGYEALGDALMPAVPFEGYVSQCFVRGCLQLRDGAVERIPLGEIIPLADVGALIAAPPYTLQEPFLEFWQTNGGEERFGSPVSDAFVRGDRVVQYTRYARLERLLDSDVVQVGRVGEDFLRLPGGVPYRWPYVSQER
ncbi:MAG: hypothetical protein GFH27_549279n312 [Chloroflexi bacterium AL-W]|nr:hypothetical protein [Chloroflexi bacterium AL-N1]NOK65278.1 hypothetical protein [Chloroflexi bacterium AL-N10]NOK72457.1 hypothetical protein [Chloroflexi bacterium AL-N5]NOK79457.1 hypothetical protein [Chloroflexi bacterium AL-W]NOK87373.1 hypothetical protein [Chloroflexi bacterium AL-N15]